MDARSEVAMRWLGGICKKLIDNRSVLGDRGTLNILLIAQAAAQIYIDHKQVTNLNIAQRLSWNGWPSNFAVDEYVSDLKSRLGVELFDEMGLIKN